MKELIENYRAAMKLLLAEKDKVFPKGSNIEVCCKGRYNGPGVVSMADGCPADKLAVRLSNGNIWWYPLEDCTPEPPPKAEVKT